MKNVIALLWYWGLMFTQCAHANDAQIKRPEWIIVATFIDLTTGERIEECELSFELRFGDPTDCKSIVDGVGPIPRAINEHWIAAFPDPTSRPARHTLQNDHLPANMLVNATSSRSSPTRAEPNHGFSPGG